jgi:hypothetical protein
MSRSRRVVKRMRIALLGHRAITVKRWRIG